MKSKVVAIDGPSGSGKSTIAKLVAKELNFMYIDTGAMFRSIGFYISEQGIKFETDKDRAENEQKIKSILEQIDFKYGESEEKLIQINSKNLTQKIREHHVSALASTISKLVCVREFLKHIQRELGQNTYSVMEGRDIGSVVFPNSFCKIYLTATAEVRANRRLEELEQKGEEFSYEKILQDIKDRDFADMNRDLAPLIKAGDAIEVDTSGLSIDEVKAEIIKIVKEKME